MLNVIVNPIAILDIGQRPTPTHPIKRHRHRALNHRTLGVQMQQKNFPIDQKVEDFVEIQDQDPLRDGVSCAHEIARGQDLQNGGEGDLGSIGDQGEEVGACRRLWDWIGGGRGLGMVRVRYWGRSCRVLRRTRLGDGG
ncbi:uncharacterized protein A4U43_C02F8030 [Asparagus officinalis]|uniref:Uncharacterized protein n=1 Tax=Asparagus officinalis TaxID=4686 RepID=A0A5P1FGT3_ASPOF|nr:uncharacterized protein A4U43_C02F8030 [Asparagus officinalis]